MNRFLRGLASEQHVIDRRVEARLLDPKARGRVALRVEVNEEGRALGEREAGREIDGSGGLSHAALLIDDRKDLSHPPAPQSGESVPRRTLLSQLMLSFESMFHGQHSPRQARS